MNAALLSQCYAFLVRLLEQYTPLKKGSPHLDCPDISKIIRLICLIRVYMGRADLGSPLDETDNAFPDSPIPSQPDAPLPQTVYTPLIVSRVEKWTFFGAKDSHANANSDALVPVSPRTIVGSPAPLDPSVPLYQEPNVSTEILPISSHTNSAYSKLSDLSCFGGLEGEDVNPLIAKMHIYLVFITVKMEQIQEASEQLGKIESATEFLELQRTVFERSREATALAQQALAVVKRQVQRDMVELVDGLPELEDTFEALSV